MWSGSPMKSIEEVSKLIEFLKSDKFRKEDLESFDLIKETERLGKYTSSGSDASAARDGWSEVSVEIKVRRDSRSTTSVFGYTNYNLGSRWKTAFDRFPRTS
jgi:hypothetical protein